jgi:hypothetical protein
MILPHPAIVSFVLHDGYAPALAPEEVAEESLEGLSLDPEGSWQLVEASLYVGSTWSG